MNATPMICPRCGELLIVRPEVTGRTNVPAHEDLVQPGTVCAYRYSPHLDRARLIEAWLDGS